MVIMGCLGSKIDMSAVSIKRSVYPNLVDQKDSGTFQFALLLTENFKEKSSSAIFNLTPQNQKIILGQRKNQRKSYF